jgi:hypothetical protein
MAKDHLSESYRRRRALEVLLAASSASDRHTARRAIDQIENPSGHLIEAMFKRSRSPGGPAL